MKVNDSSILSNLYSSTSDISVLSTFVNSYSFALLINFDSGKSRVIKDNDNFFAFISNDSEGNIFSVGKKVVSSLVIPDDRERILHYTDPECLKKHFNKNNALTLFFRVTSKKNGCRYIKVCFMRLFNKPVVHDFLMGIDDITDTYLERESLTKLAEDNSIIYLVNLLNGTFKQIGSYAGIGVLPKEGLFDNSMKAVPQYISDEYHNIIHNFINIEALKKFLSAEDRREMTLKINSPVNPWRRLTLKVVDRENGIPSFAVLSLVTLDEYVAETIEHKQLQEEALHKSFEALNNFSNAIASLNTQLCILSDYYRSDRAVIIEFNEQTHSISLTYEWCAFGIQSYRGLMQNLTLETDPNWFGDLKNNGLATIANLDDSEYAGTSVYSILLNYQVHTIISVPLLDDGKIVGFISLDNPQANTDDLMLLRLSSVLSYSEILMRKQSEEGHIVHESLGHNFITVEYVDLKSGYWNNHVISDSSRQHFLNFKSYAAACNYYCQHYVDSKDREYFSKSIQADNVIAHLKQNHIYSINFVDIGNGYPRNFQMQFIRADRSGNTAVVCTMDNTELVAKEKQIQLELEEARRQADLANEAKSRFLFNMSHDIRTPMNAIMGFTEKAISNAENPDIVRDCLKKVSVSNEYLLKLINDVLDMARIESGKLSLNLAPHNVLDTAESISDMFNDSLKEHQLTLYTDFSDIRSDYVLQDELRVRQIITNILSNAIKYTGAGGSINFSIHTMDCEIPGYRTYIYTVKDTGIGMSPDFLKHIFEQFERERTSTESRIQGTGLGMAIVKKIVDLMDGDINITSEQNLGTEVKVTLTFKLCEADEVRTMTAPVNIDCVNFDGMKILLVEDNELNREIAETILKDHNIDVFSVCDGAEAIKHLEDEGNRYDLVFMDIQMPVVNGYDATRAIRALQNRNSITPIIAMTANAFEEDHDRAINSGMNGYICKPFSKQQLLNILSEYRMHSYED